MTSRYWISTAGTNFSNTAGWSATSGGAGGASVPSGTTFDVFVNASGLLTFDISPTLNSFTTTAGTTINANTKTLTLVSSLCRVGGIDLGASLPIIALSGSNVICSGAFVNSKTINYNTVTFQSDWTAPILDNRGTIKTDNQSEVLVTNSLTSSGYIHYLSFVGSGTIPSGNYGLITLGGIPFNSYAQFSGVYNCSGLAITAATNNTVKFNNSTININTPTTLIHGSVGFDIVDADSNTIIDFGTCIINNQDTFSYTALPTFVPNTTAVMNFTTGLNQNYIYWPAGMGLSGINISNTHGALLLDSTPIAANVRVLNGSSIMSVGIDSITITGNLTLDSGSALYLYDQNLDYDLPQCPADITITGNFIASGITGGFQTAPRLQNLTVGGNMTLIGMSNSYFNLLSTSDVNFNVTGAASGQYLKLSHIDATLGSTFYTTYSYDGCDNIDVIFGIGTTYDRTINSISQRIICDKPIVIDNGSILYGGSTDANVVYMGTAHLTKVRLGSHVVAAKTSNPLPNYDLQSIQSVDIQLGNSIRKPMYVTSIRNPNINTAGINLETGRPISTPTVDNSSLAPSGSVTLPTRGTPGSIRFVSAAKTPDSANYGSKNT